MGLADGQSIEKSAYAQTIGGIYLHSEPMRKRIQDQIAFNEDRNKKIARILEIMDAHPEIEELINLMRETGF